MTQKQYRRIGQKLGITLAAFLAATGTVIGLAGTATGGGTALAAAYAQQGPLEEPQLVVTGPVAGRVFVVADGTLTAEVPQFGTAGLAAITTGQTATVAATVTVLPYRAIIVGQEGRIKEIWSNATIGEFGFFALTVKEKETGVVQPLTPAIAEQYNLLRGQIEWGRAGRVW